MVVGRRGGPRSGRRGGRGRRRAWWRRSCGAARSG